MSSGLTPAGGTLAAAWRRPVGRRRPLTAGAIVAAGLAIGVMGLPGVAGAVGEDPGAEVAEALRSLGPPGVVWGRLLVEEESPLGPWTPIGGVEVTVYPATPSLTAELERIRQSARASGAQYESAVARIRSVLATHQARLDAKSPETWGSDGALPAEPPIPQPARPKALSTAVPAAPPIGGAAGVTVPGDRAGEPPAHPWRQNTDPAGLFAFDPLPSGDWLVVAVRTSAYGGQKFRSTPRQQPGGTRGFLPRAAGPAREVEIWMARVRVHASERVGLELTDRARWFVGPVR